MHAFPLPLYLYPFNSSYDTPSFSSPAKLARECYLTPNSSDWGK
jgi:hypothetical protein